MTSDRFRSPRGRAIVVKVAIAVVLGAIGVVAPVPKLTDAPAMATETRRPFAVPGAPGSTSTTLPPATSTPPLTVAEDTRDFSLIGVTLAETPESPVRVRTAPNGGAWGPWQEIDFDTERALEPVGGAPVPQEPDVEAPGVHSDPLWVGDASRYELQLPPGVADDARVHLVYETSRKVAVAATEAAGADPGGPSILPRSAWGARPPKVTPTIAPALKLAVVHHTAGSNNYSSAEVPAVLRAVQAYHMDANGWDDIAYNFAIDRSGRIWEARAGGVTKAVVGAHSRGFNTGSTGVAVLGNFETASPSSAVISSLGSLLAWKLAVHDLDPRTTVAFRAGEGSPKFPPGTVVTLNPIVGHRDVGLTSCPGRNLYPYLGTIRASVARAYPSLAPPGLALVGNFAGSSATDVFLRQPGVRGDQLLVARSGGFTVEATFRVQGTTYRPRVGDFDGNGFDDIFWYAPGSAADSVWLSQGNGAFTHVSRPVQGTYSPVVGDFDSDGDDDIFWYAPGTAPESMWVAAGGRFGHVATRQVASSLRPVAGDFDADGDDDMFWHGPGDVGDSLWSSANGAFTTRSATQVRGSYLPATGDFDGDGGDDIFWYAPGAAPESVWTSEALQFRSAAVPAVRGSYPYVRPGNYGDDGRAEVLWYSSPGQDSIWWHTSSAALFGRPLATVPALR